MYKINEKNRKIKSRKSLSLTLCLLLCMLLLCSCDGKKSEDITEDTTSTTFAVTDDKEHEKIDSKVEEAENGDDENDMLTDGNAVTAKKDGTTPVEEHGALHVDGTNMVDEYGQIVQLKGVSTGGLSWFPQFANKEAFQTMQEEWGIEIIRLAMYTAESNGYCVGDDANRQKLEDKIDECVEAATELGLYVIIDWHILSDHNPSTYEEEAIDFFDRVSEKYQDNKNILYEICNEPNGSTTWSDIKEYAETIIPVIRNHAESSIIIVGTPTWSQDVDQAAADPITDADNIMYALHFYAATHKDSLRSKLALAMDAGLPIFVTEFGICDASGNGMIDEEQSALWIELMDEKKASYCIWNLSNKNETSALLSASTNKTAGWTIDELSDSGKWFVNMMKGNLTLIGTSGITGDEWIVDDGGDYVPPANDSFKLEEDEYTVQASTSNTWASGNDYFYQYDVAIKNKGKSNIEDWKIKITFASDIEISNSWCCTASASKNVLTISPADWNGTIESKNTVSDIGIILSSEGENKVTDIQFQ